jgi:NAD(P)-dependent dehydrogenase (short-subunit alcohol dehydrogenase family)
MDLSGETVLVTGADRGIGRALVEELATRDVRVLAGVRSVKRFEPLHAAQALEVPSRSMRKSFEAGYEDEELGRYPERCRATATRRTRPDLSVRTHKG